MADMRTALSGGYAEQMAPMIDPRYAGMTHTGQEPVGMDTVRAFQAMPGQIADWARNNPLDAGALAVSPVPVVGDALGFANDMRHMIQNPEERTWGNAALAGAGLLPFVPPMAGVVRGAKGAGEMADALTDLPMDEASRVARSLGQGYDVDVYHATTKDFPEFEPGWRGSNYFAQTPEGAHRGASFGRLDNASTDADLGNSTNITMPLKIRSQDIKGLSVNKDVWDSLPDVISNDDELTKYVDKIKETGSTYWDDAYESVLQSDGSYKYYKRDAPSIKYQDMNGRDVFGYLLGGFNSGSDVNSLDRAKKIGKSGFLVSDEAGTTIVGGPNLKVRSRFAAFDPAKRDSTNLLAGIAGGAIVTPAMIEALNGERNQ